MASFGKTSFGPSLSEPDTPVHQVDLVDGAADVPANLLVHGDYSRAGADLVIQGPEGTVVVRGYFAAEAPTLTAPNGARLDAEMVHSLLRAPVQVAAGEGAAAEQIAQAAQPIGTVAKASGTVTVQRADGTTVELQPGDPVYQGDIVITGDDASVGLTFVDGTQFSLGAAGRMVLDELVYNPASGEGSAGFNLLSGSFSFVSGAIAKAGTEAMMVKTPVATIGIRGTSGSISVGASTDAELKVVLIPDPDGTVGEIQVTTAAGQTFSINAPMGAFKIANGQPQTFTMTQQEFSREFGRALDGLDQRDALEERVREVAPQSDDGQQGDDQSGQTNDQGDGQDGQDGEEGDGGQDGNDGQDDQEDQDGETQDQDKTGAGDEGQDKAANGDDPTDNGNGTGNGGEKFIQVVNRDDDPLGLNIERDGPQTTNPGQGQGQGQGSGSTGSGGGSTGAGKGFEDDLTKDDDNNTDEGSTGSDTTGDGDGGGASTVAGRIVDPYVKNATVWIDYDGDGVQDADEPSTTSDSQGHFSLQGRAEGRLMSSGGQDSVSNADVGTFTAPIGSSVVTPLTTVMQSMIESGAATSAADAQGKLATALGLSVGSTDITNFDPYGAVDAGAGPGTLAADLLTKGVLVQNVISMVSGALAGAGVTGAAADRAAFKALAAMSNGQRGTAFLKDTTQLTSLIQQAASEGGASLPASAASSLAGAIGNLTTELESAAASAADPTALVAKLASLARVAQVEGRASAKTFIEGGGSDAAFASRFQGDSLKTLIEDAEQGVAPLAPVLIGTDAADTLTGGAVNDTIYGHGGNDTLSGLGGADSLFGGAGDDTLIGGAGKDALNGGDGTDTASYAAAGAGVTVDLSTGTATGGAGTDTLSGIENVTGGAYGDVLTGDTGANVLRGGDGNDQIWGGGGADSLFGDAGDDMLLYSASAATIDGGTGFDTLRVLDGGEVTLSNVGGVEVVDLTGGGGATLDLSVQAARALSGATGEATLRILGDDADAVRLTGTWQVAGSVTVGDITYDQLVGQDGDAAVYLQVEHGLVNIAPVLAVATVAYSETMDSDPGWDGLGAVADGGWAWGAPAGLDDPASGATGDAVIGYNLSDVNDGHYPDNLLETGVTTGPIAIDGDAGYVVLSYERWLTVEGDDYDYAHIDASTDGVAWTRVWTNGSDVIEDVDWTTHRVDLSSVAVGHDTLYLRWVMGETDDSVNYGGWNIDDVTVLTAAAPIAAPEFTQARLLPAEAIDGILVSDLTSNGIDANGDTLGVALTDLDSTVGSWSYSLDGGDSWTDIGALSDTSALVLDATARLRFVPTDEAWSSGTLTVSYRLWDGSDGLSSGDDGIDVSAAGGLSAYSAATGTATLEVLEPNQRPEIMSESALTEMASQHDVVQVYAGSLNETGEMQAPIIVDSDGPFFLSSPDFNPEAAYVAVSEGYAIVGTTGAGLWQYTLNGGGTWTDLPDVSDTSALLLTGELGNRLRFLPTDPASATEASLYYKAWDGADGLESGATGVDTVNEYYHAYSTGTLQYVITYTEDPDWVGGTAAYSGQASQWDSGAVPTSFDAAYIHSDVGDVVTFGGQGPIFGADDLIVTGTAGLVVEDGGGIVVEGSLNIGAEASLSMTGGTLTQAPAYVGSDWIWDGDIALSGGQIKTGDGYTEIKYGGTGPLRLHDGASGTLSILGGTLQIQDGSSAEMLNTSITGGSAQNSSGTWFSASMMVLGDLDVYGTSNVLHDANFNLTIGDRLAGAVNGTMTVHAEGQDNYFTTDSIYNYGTITLTSDTAGAGVAMSPELAFLSFRNNGGVILATGEAGATHSITTDMLNQVNPYHPDQIGLIRVDEGVTLTLSSIINDGGTFDIDGTLGIQGVLTAKGTTTVDGTGSLEIIGSLSLDAGATLALGETVSIVNYGTVSGQTGSIIDLDANDDGTAGTFVDAGGSVTSVSIGNSPGTFTIDGHYAIQGEATGAIYELGGTAPGTGHDQLVVTGTMARGGTIAVAGWNGFAPTVGDSFDIIRYGTATGSFHHAQGLDTWADQGVVLDARVGDTGVALTAVAVTGAGTEAAETLFGSAGDDVLVGFGGNDVLVGNGGRDLLYGGAGDDILRVAEGFGRADGGEGFDTLVFDGSLDLSGLGGELFDGIEAVALDGGDALVLDAHAAASFNDGDAPLVISGGANDSVALSGEWTVTSGLDIGGVGYSVCTADDGTVLHVQDDIQLTTAA